MGDSHPPAQPGAIGANTRNARLRSIMGIEEAPRNALPYTSHHDPLRSPKSLQNKIRCSVSRACVGRIKELTRLKDDVGES
jgi:hypothetical protein